MKLLKEYPDINILSAKIKLTTELKEAYENYCSEGEDEIFIVGSAMGDFFISPDEPTKETRRLYPLPPSVETSMFLECEVIELMDMNHNKQKDG
jgi:hypothetical protein